jgi:hypothetical protein
MKFQRCFSLHITGFDVSRVTELITNAAMVSNAKMLSKVDVLIM